MRRTAVLLVLVIAGFVLLVSKMQRGDDSTPAPTFEAR
jgi:hypothetical protein